MEEENLNMQGGEKAEDASLPAQEPPVEKEATPAEAVPTEAEPAAEELKVKEPEQKEEEEKGKEEEASPSASGDRRWYVIQALTGQEDKVKQAIELTVVTQGLKNKIFQVLVP
ncbi:MAG: hypothetical protein WCT39_01765, partial [Candidatus Margulisiibacteriota bacterium]